MENRNASLPRKIKWITEQGEETNTTQIYDFYRQIIHNCILRLKTEKDRLHYSSWLARLDGENGPLKMHLIRVLLISLKNSRPYHIFLNIPPDDLSELNLKDENTMEMLLDLEKIKKELLATEVKPPDEIQFRRTAAVSSDMCTYTATKASPSLIQTFFVRSDFPIYTWNNPASIVVPENFDHNQWELYLNRFEIVSQKKKTDEDRHRNTCASVYKHDQVTREMDTSCAFRWHPHSVLYTFDRPKRRAAFIEIDQVIKNQLSTQLQIDETAFSIVYKKSFPGYKTLDPRIYSTTLMPDPNFVYKITGVRFTYDSATHSSFLNKELLKKEQTRSSGTCSRQRKCCLKDNCKDDCRSFIKPCITSTGTQSLETSFTTPNVNKLQNLSLNKSLVTQKQMDIVKAKNDLVINTPNNAPHGHGKLLTNFLQTNKSLNSDGVKNISNSNKPNISTEKQPKNSFGYNNQSQNYTNISQSRVQNSSQTSNRDLSTNQILAMKHLNTSKRTPCNSNKPCNNQRLQYSNQMSSPPIRNSSNTRTGNAQNSRRQYHGQDNYYCQDQQFHSAKANGSYPVKSRNDECRRENSRERTVNTCSKTERRCTPIPGILNKTQQSSKIENWCSQNGNFSSPVNSPPDTNCYTDINERPIGPTHDENWTPDVASYTEFTKVNHRRENQSSLKTVERQTQMSLDDCLENPERLLDRIDQCTDQREDQCDELCDDQCDDSCDDQCDDPRDNPCDNQRDNPCDDKRANPCDDQRDDPCGDQCDDQCDDQSDDQCDDQSDDQCDVQCDDQYADKRDDQCVNQPNHQSNDQSQYSDFSVEISMRPTGQILRPVTRCVSSNSEKSVSSFTSSSDESNPDIRLHKQLPHLDTCKQNFNMERRTGEIEREDMTINDYPRMLVENESYYTNTGIQDPFLYDSQISIPMPDKTTVDINMGPINNGRDRQSAPSNGTGTRNTGIRPPLGDQSSYRNDSPYCDNLENAENDNRTDIGVCENKPDGNRSRNSGARRSLGNECWNDNWPCSRSNEVQNIENVSMLNISSDWEQNTNGRNENATGRSSMARCRDESGALGRSYGAGRRDESGALGRSYGAGRRGESEALGRSTGAGSRYTSGTYGQQFRTNNGRIIGNVSTSNSRNDWRHYSDGNDSMRSANSRRSFGTGRRGNSLNDPFC